MAQTETDNRGTRVSSTFFKFLSDLFEESFADAVTSVQVAIQAGELESAKTMLRLGAQKSGGKMFDYMRLQNLWRQIKSPALKPNPTEKHLLLLTDFTPNSFESLLPLFCAAYGLHITIDFPLYDSVEQEVLNPESSLYQAPHDTVVLCLSEYWLNKHLGTGAIVSREQIKKTCKAIEEIVANIEKGARTDVLVTNFSESVYPFPSSLISTAENKGRNAAIIPTLSRSKVNFLALYFNSI